MRAFDQIARCTKDISILVQAQSLASALMKDVDDTPIHIRRLNPEAATIFSALSGPRWDDVTWNQPSVRQYLGN
jgi:hypothetical protein